MVQTHVRIDFENTLFRLCAWDVATWSKMLRQPEIVASEKAA